MSFFPNKSALFAHIATRYPLPHSTESDSMNTYLLQMDPNSSGDTAEFYIHTLKENGAHRWTAFKIPQKVSSFYNMASEVSYVYI